MNIDKLIKAIKDANMIYICGNGGSASTAEHFANDLFKKGYSAICLSSNVSIMTMIANDYGYEYVFSKQLETYATKRDILITISCSGNSENIIFAHGTAFSRGMIWHQFPTFKRNRDYGKLENKHLQIAHEVADRL